MDKPGRGPNIPPAKAERASTETTSRQDVHVRTGIKNLTRGQRQYMHAHAGSHNKSRRQQQDHLSDGPLVLATGVRTETTRTRPSAPGCTAVTRARGQVVGVSPSSRMQTKLPTRALRVGDFHFVRSWRC